LTSQTNCVVVTFWCCPSNTETLVTIRLLSLYVRRLYTFKMSIISWPIWTKPYSKFDKLVFFSSINVPLMHSMHFEPLSLLLLHLLKLWRPTMTRKPLFNLCIGTCLLEPRVATPWMLILKLYEETIYLRFFYL
jgi:hypothetical protein